MMKPRRLDPAQGNFQLPLGDRGEMIAWNYLIQRGYRLLEKNYRCRIGEVDVIAKKGKRIAFIEVKTRSSDRYGTPSEAVHAQKQKKMARLAEWYLKEKKIIQAPVSFDVVEVKWDLKSPQIRLIENAFSLDESFF